MASKSELVQLRPPLPRGTAGERRQAENESLIICLVVIMGSAERKLPGENRIRERHREGGVENKRREREKKAGMRV